MVSVRRMDINGVSRNRILLDLDGIIGFFRMNFRRLVKFCSKLKGLIMFGL